jgi:hypothetical protein
MLFMIVTPLVIEFITTQTAVAMNEIDEWMIWPEITPDLSMFEQRVTTW